MVKEIKSEMTSQKSGAAGKDFEGRINSKLEEMNEGF
jgi:hypothetical protein